MDIPFFFLPPASATLALVLRVAFSLGMVIDLAKIRVSTRVDVQDEAVKEVNQVARWVVFSAVVVTMKGVLPMA